MNRPSKAEAMMLTAHVFARRSTCPRLQVGAVVADLDMTTIYSVGYNGNARGLANGCDQDVPGACGCLHAEVNALLKAPYDRGDLLLFTTHAPCSNCAKAIINSRVAHVFYAVKYRTNDGLVLLRSANIRTSELPVT